MIEVSALITLERVPELGLNDRIKSGLRPSFNYAGELVTCIVESSESSEWLEVGTKQPVTVQLPYGDQLGWQLPIGTIFLLNVGGRVIGNGTVTSCSPPPTPDS
jgi:hypothetical protein